MRAWVYGFAMLGALASAADAGATMSVERYLESTQGTSADVEDPAVDIYILGALDTLTLMGDLAYDAGAPIFCMPPEQSLNIDLAEFRHSLDMALDQMAENVSDFDELSRSRSIGLAMIQLMIEVFPCDGDSE